MICELAPAVRVELPVVREDGITHWGRALIRDADTGQVRKAVREFCIRVNAEGVGLVETIELTDERGVALTDDSKPALDENGQLAERKFSYILAGISIKE